MLIYYLLCPVKSVDANMIFTSMTSIYFQPVVAKNFEDWFTEF